VSAEEPRTRSKGAHVWKRDSLDWYVEESRASAALFEVESFVGPIWDPCCGRGNILHSYLRTKGACCIGTDIVRRCDDDIPFFGELDFLGEFDHAAMIPAFHSNIVMNPPFFRAKGAEAFIRKALKLANGKVCAFVDMRFLSGAERANGLFADHPPHRIWIVTPRVSCPPGEYLSAGNKAGGGTADYCWLVFDLTSPAPSSPYLGWLRKSASARDHGSAA
jgi:hypothetical protein